MDIGRNVRTSSIYSRSFHNKQNEVLTFLNNNLIDQQMYSWFAHDVTKILKSKPGGLQNFYLSLMKDYLKIYLFTIP